MTREEYTRALIENAKEIQGENYAGNNYYTQDCWDDYYEDGTDPRKAVLEDMSYWDY